MAAPRPRATRSDGERSRREILDVAARIATVHGLQHLSIGQLAGEVGMSKSGLYAHFGSKEELQLATIDTAEEIYDREVYDVAERSGPGLDALLALVDAHLDHLRRRVFPGGCFFDAAAADLVSSAGPVRDRIRGFHAGWLERVGRYTAQAIERGQLPADIDVRSVVWDITAAMALAHSMIAFYDDDAALDQAGASVRRRLGLG